MESSVRWVPVRSRHGTAARYDHAVCRRRDDALLPRGCLAVRFVDVVYGALDTPFDSRRDPLTPAPDPHSASRRDTADVRAGSTTCTTTGSSPTTLPVAAACLDRWLVPLGWASARLGRWQLAGSTPTWCGLGCWQLAQTRWRLCLDRRDLALSPIHGISGLGSFLKKDRGCAVV
jgi:hypothetical protein